MDDSYVGHENLELISHSQRFNNWLFEEILPGLHGDILEVGSGIGTFTDKLINGFPASNITLTDVSLAYCRELGNRYSGNKKISTCQLDLNNSLDYERIGYGKFDSIVAINVLEHVEKDEFALRQLYRMLKDRGTLILLVPCHGFLYNVIDKNVGHFRRYTKSDLEAKIRKTEFTVDRVFYFNVLGMLGWYLNGNLFKKSQVSGMGLKVMDALVPTLKRIERITGKRVGLSLICYLKKETEIVK
jgi:SAM-dependent methyltransferase